MPRRIACALLLWFSVSVCGSAQVIVNGVGSTFVYPIFTKWVDVYQKQHQDVRIEYLPLGSGAGIAQTLNGMVDFGGTDAPVADAELSRAIGFDASKSKVRALGGLFATVGVVSAFARYHQRASIWESVGQNFGN